MNTFESLPDKIKQLIKKVHELAINGVDGEMEAAKSKLNALLAKYDLKIEDVIGSNEPITEYEFRYDKKHKRLFFQIVSSVIPDWDGVHYKINQRSNTYNFVIIYATKLQYVEIMDKYDFYTKDFEEQMKIFYGAYVQKNQLYANKSSSNDDRELSEDEINQLRKMFQMMEGIEQKTHYKKLEA